MKESTTDKVAGKINETTGKIKEKAGQVTNDPELMAEGQDQKLGGTIRKKIGQIEQVFEK